MKLKYTLVFTIISFFITIAGFAQQYSDQEIGFNATRVATSLKEHGVKDADMNSEVARMREMHTAQYLQNIKSLDTYKKEIKKTAKSSMKSEELATPAELAQDRAALIALYNSTNGAGWANTQQGKGVWAINDPNAVITSWNPDTNTGWYGITTEPSGRVTGLYLESNNLNGTLPSQIGQLSKLYSLTIKSNLLSGTNIPAAIGQLQDLLVLDLGNNNLSGSIPIELGQLSKMVYLSLDFNAFTGSIPTEILMPNLIRINLGYNQLSGNIPPEIGNLIKVESLTLTGNKLNGSIPPQIGNLAKIDWLAFPSNELTGSIPTEIGQLITARTLYFDYNNLTGPIPSEIKTLANLGTFWAYDNQLSGSIPAEFGLLKNLFTIRLSLNNFTGSIPPEIGEATQLRQFEAGENKLTGSIPDTFKNLPKLSTLVLNDNRLSGKIPNLTALPLSTFRLYRNAFRFVDFTIEEHSIYRSKMGYSNYSYPHQVFVDEEKTIVKNSGESVTFTMYEDGRFTPNDTYQWYHFHGNTTIAVPGATSRTLTVENIKFKDSGDYYCISTNPYITYKPYWESNLYLTKNTIHLNVNVICEPLVGTIKTPAGTISANQDINISFENSGTNLTYNWTFYDLDNTTILLNTIDSSPSLYYPLPGTYKINLVVTDENRCTTSFDRTITIAPQVCPIVTGTIKTGANNLLVNANSLFYLDSPSNFSSYEWTFYDLNNNIDETIYGNYRIKSFNAPGNYRVRLTVIDQNRCKTNIDKTVTVTQPQACPSQETGTIFSGENDTVYINTNNEFYFNTNTDQDLHYNWTIYNPDNTINNTFIGNDNYISGLNFTTAGTYKIMLKITDMSGCTATFSRNFNAIYNCYTYGMIKDRDYPFSNEGLQPVVPNTNLTLYYNSFTSDTDNKEYSWSFLSPNGDIIKTGNGENFNVTPTTIGDYKVLVQLTDTVTGCVNNFDAILPCVDECEMSNSERGGKITINGDYDTSEEAIFVELNKPIDLGLNRTYYSDTGRPLSFEWSLLNPNAQIVSTGTDTLFPIVLTSPGFYKVVLKVTDAFNGCSTEVTRAFGNQMTNSCTQTNERSSQVHELARALAKKLLQRTASGETDIQINNSSLIDEFIALKPFITNSPKDKIYNYKTTRDRYNAIISMNFSFSPDRESDFYISIRDGVYTNGVTPDYLNYLIDKAVYVDVSQYVSSNEILASCWVYDQNNRSMAKSVLDPKDCRYSSEIKNINFCPPACNVVTGALKQSTQEIFTNRNTNFSLETAATDLTYKWTFYNLGNEGITVYTTNSVDNIYTQQGSYDIKLEVTDSNGCVTTFNKTVIATVNTNCNAPVGTIKTSTPEVFVGTNTNFSLETAATDLSYKWTFTQNGESTIITTKTVDYTYIAPGTNNVTLEVIDSNGCKFTFQKLVNLKTGSSLCDNVTQFGRSFVQVGSDNDLYRAAKIIANQSTNVTFPIQSYGSAFDFEYKWSLLNENDQLVDSGTSLNFPIMPTSGGFYRIVLDLKENTSGCVHQFSRSIVCLIPNSCAQTNPQSSVVKGLVVNLIKNLIARAMLGENDAQINSSTVTAEFNALKPYITSGLKDKIYNFTSTRNLNGEFTGVDFSFASDRASDIHISIPHSLRYEEDMPMEDLLSLIESKIYINLNQYSSSNQYLVSCYTQQSTGKSLLKPNDCQYGSEIKFIDFCPNECDPLLGVIKLNTEKPALNTVTNFSLETVATGLTYNWTFYNADNSIKETQTTATVSQTYTVAGTYKVILIATDANNCTTTFTKTITITAPSCVAATGTIKTVLPNIFVGTTANFFFDTTATNLTYQWTLYRTVNSSTATFTSGTADMYYDAPGNYNVKLVVTDVNGCTNTFRTTAVVTVKPPCVTVSGDIKTANPIISTNENTTFSFETTASNLRYNWTFHSLNNTPLLTTTQSNPTLVYPYANDYKVSLTVTDENNCFTTIEKYITVQVKHICAEIVGTIKTSTEKIKTNNSAVFSLQTAATNIAYKWIFYNTNSVEIGTATTSTAEWTYTTPGDYLVELVITDQYSCITKLYKTVKVTEPVECTPIVGTIKMDTETPFLYTYVNFTFETTATDLTYTWNVKIPENGGTYNYPQGGNPFQLYLQYGEGEYTILLDVKDSNDCITHFEKTFTPTYDCSRNSVTGIIYNRTHSEYYSPNILINKPNEFTFWPYSMWNLSDLTLNWELTKLDDTPITSFTGEVFVFTPTTSDNLKLKLTIKDRNGCPHYFDRELEVMDACAFSGENLSGSIAFENEDNAEVSTLQINQTKELGFRPDREITRSYTYKWEIYNANDELVDSGNQEKHLLTLTTAGFYKVNVAIENAAGCILNFTKPVNCLIQNSCTNENPKSEIVKNIYLNVLKNLIARSLTNETDEHINASRATDEFEALKPYITNGTKDKIYNYTTARDEQGRLISVRFSFSPDRNYDVQILLKKGLWNFDSDYDGTLTQFSANIAAEIYMDLSQYTSSDNYLISCYVQNAQQSSVPNPENPPTVQRAQKTKKLSKISLNTTDCYKESEIRYIDFCPAQACKPTIGVIQSGFGLANPSRPDKNSKKSGSKL
ncbi:PKD domain-containing protein [Flavobacterium cupreum]|nr:PKD domain-containing protein [Flavobacterium cupreum]